MGQELTTLQKILDKAIEFMVQYSFQIFGAVLILACGLLLANRIAALVFGVMQKKKLDITLSKFAASFVRIMILGFAVLIALGKFGITITPFIAALGALTFGFSMAVQGPLSNYGAGLSIILSRPYAVGDTITVSDVSGVVQDIKLACTVLTNEDGIRITIPNKKVVGEVLYNSMKNKVAEGVVGISYSSDPEKAIGVIRSVLDSTAEVMQSPQPQIGVQEFGDSSIHIGYRYWVPTIRYFQLTYAINLAIFNAFRDAGVSIPFPQREVRILSAETTSAEATAAKVPQ